jgi:hypothetical protein
MEYLVRVLTGVPARMIWNIDETGFQRCADAMDQMVVVPSDYEGTEIPLPVVRGGKRSSAIVAISASGSSLKPVIIIARKTIEVELMQAGITQQNCMIVDQKCGFVNMAIFEMSVPWPSFLIFFRPDITWDTTILPFFS